MSQFDIDTVMKLRGATVRDRGGEKIGTLGDVFLDRDTDRPAWVGVKTGLFGAKQSYVSLAAAKLAGGEVHLPHDKDLVKNAPHVEPEVSLDAAEEEALYRHYGEDYGTSAVEAPAGAGATAEGAEPAAATEPASTASLQDSGDAMIRSEEEVRLGHIERRPTERVRIKKVTVTENVRQVVPVRREVVQLEHEPAPSGNIESVEELPEGEPRPDAAA